MRSCDPPALHLLSFCGHRARAKTTQPWNHQVPEGTCWPPLSCPGFCTAPAIHPPNSHQPRSHDSTIGLSPSPALLLVTLLPLPGLLSYNPSLSTRSERGENWGSTHTLCILCTGLYVLVQRSPMEMKRRSSDVRWWQHVAPLGVWSQHSRALCSAMGEAA